MKARMVVRSGASSNWPFGLLMLEQILASLALAAMPAEMVMLVWGRC